MLSRNPKIGFIGFGEVAYYFSKGLKEDGIKEIIAYEKALGEPVYGEVIRNRAQDTGVQLVSSLKELVESAELVISSVWGSIALDVAKEAAAFVSPGKVYADVNNTAPSAKTRGAKVLNAKEALYVDVALFVSPAVLKHRSLVYVSGDGAEEFNSVMSNYGMDIEIVPGEAGKATTIKTLTNIYYKGIQALDLELALAAWKTDIDLDIIAPLAVKPVQDLPKEKELGFWMIRGGIHAERKAAELEEIVEEVRDWGLEPMMMEATKKRLNTIGQYKLKDYFKSELALENYKALMEAIDKIGKEKNIPFK
jgi:3-hydroxyisobutyrate dehydrogenase-like beta-hydroxyacid dehydrogenase